MSTVNDTDNTNNDVDDDYADADDDGATDDDGDDGAAKDADAVVNYSYTL